MHPLENVLDEEFHRKPQQRRRSSLDNSCLSSKESFLSLLADIETYDYSQKRRRFSLNNTQYKPTTFLAGLLPRSDNKDVLDLGLHNSTHREGQPVRDASGRYVSQRSSKVEEDMTLDSSESILGDDDDDDDDDSCDSFCDAEEGEPANRSYLRQDLGASCFWDDDLDDMGLDEDGDDKQEIKVVITKSLPQSNERIQAALSRVRNGKKGTKNTPATEASNWKNESSIWSKTGKNIDALI